MAAKINTSMRNKERRLNSFTDGIEIRGLKEKVYWIDNYNDEIVEPLIECGFYYSPKKISLNRITCYFCGKSENYEENMDIVNMLKEHYSKNKGCSLSVIMKSLSEFESMKYTSNADSLSFWSNHVIDEIRNPLTKTATKLRTKFFKNFPINNNSSVNISSLSEAGFIYLPNFEGDDRVSCYYCNCSLEGWEDGDIPIEEHKKNTNKYCYFLELCENNASTDKVKSKGKRKNVTMDRKSLSLNKNYDIEQIEEINSSLEKLENKESIDNEVTNEESIKDVEKTTNSDNSTSANIEINNYSPDSKRKHSEPLRRSKRIKSKKSQVDPNDEYWNRLPDNDLFDEIIGTKSDEKSNLISVSSDTYEDSDDSFNDFEDKDQSYLEDGKSISQEISIPRNVESSSKKKERTPKAVNFNLDVKDSKNDEIRNDIINGRESPKRSTKRIKLVNKEFSVPSQQYNTSDQNLGDYEDYNIKYLESNVIPLKNLKQKIGNKLEGSAKHEKKKIHSKNFNKKSTESDVKTSPVKSGLIERKKSLNPKGRPYNILDTSFEDENFETFDIKKFLRVEKDQNSQILRSRRSENNDEVKSKTSTPNKEVTSDNFGGDETNLSKLEINAGDVSGSTEIEILLEQKETDIDREVKDSDTELRTLSKSPGTEAKNLTIENQNIEYSNFVEGIKQINEEISKSLESLSSDGKNEDEIEVNLERIKRSNLDSAGSLPNSQRKYSKNSSLKDITDISFKIKHGSANEGTFEIDYEKDESTFNHSDSESFLGSIDDKINRSPVITEVNSNSENIADSGNVANVATATKDDDANILVSAKNSEIEVNQNQERIEKEPQSINIEQHNIEELLSEVFERDGVQDQPRKEEVEEEAEEEVEAEVEEEAEEEVEAEVEETAKEAAEKGVDVNVDEVEDEAEEERKENDNMKGSVHNYDNYEDITTKNDYDKVEMVDDKNLEQLDETYNEIKDHERKLVGAESNPQELVSNQILNDNKQIENSNNKSKLNYSSSNSSFQAIDSDDKEKDIFSKEKNSASDVTNVNGSISMVENLGESEIPMATSESIISSHNNKHEENNVARQNENENTMMNNSIPSTCLELSPPKQMNKLSGDYSALLEASTPQDHLGKGSKPLLSPDNSQWRPSSLAQFLDNLTNFEETTKYLKAISTSKNELHNDFDSELTNFISAMPEEEENMTIHQWVRHCSSNCGKLIKDSFDEMIQFYEKEYLRGLEALRSLPTSD